MMPSAEAAKPIGPVVAQPLFVKDLEISGHLKDLLYVVTRHNEIYAFDVNSNGTRAPFWKIELPVVPLAADPQPITAVWRESDVDQHLDLFTVGQDGAVLSNFWERDA
jgi:hypothetical protein